MSNKDSIVLSKEHGLHPTIPLCFICGKPRNEVVLLGAQGDKIARAMGSHDGAMPMHCLLDRKPCDECLENMKRGIFLIETKSATDHSTTGSYWLVKEEGLKGLMTPKAFEEACKIRVIPIDMESAKALGFHDVKPTKGDGHGKED